MKGARTLCALILAAGISGCSSTLTRNGETHAVVYLSQVPVNRDLTAEERKQLMRDKMAYERAELESDEDFYEASGGDEDARMYNGKPSFLSFSVSFPFFSYDYDDEK